MVNLIEPRKPRNLLVKLSDIALDYIDAHSETCVLVTEIQYPTQHCVREDSLLTTQTPTLPFSDQRGPDICPCHRFVYAGVFGVHHILTPAPLGAQQGGHWVYQTTDCRAA